MDWNTPLTWAVNAATLGPVLFIGFKRFSEWLASRTKRRKEKLQDRILEIDKRLANNTIAIALVGMKIFEFIIIALAAFVALGILAVGISTPIRSNSEQVAVFAMIIELIFIVIMVYAVALDSAKTFRELYAPEKAKDLLQLKIKRLELNEKEKEILTKKN